MSLSIARACNREHNSGLMGMKFEAEINMEWWGWVRGLVKNYSIVDLGKERISVSILRTNTEVHFSRTFATFFSWKRNLSSSLYLIKV